jgi:arabinofuranan 3-O-arabinosyltransferase
MEISEVVLKGLHGVRYTPSPLSRTGQPCGFGPPVFVDGIRHQTRVTGTIGQLLSGEQLSVRLCGGDTVDLATGPHRIRIASTAQFQPVKALLVPSHGSQPPAIPARASRVVSWGDTERTLRVSAGPASVVWVRENTNPGWAATVDGRPLEPVVLDGWAQGWRLPSGGPVTVRLTFTPQAGYVTALAVGGGLAGLLACSAVLVVVRRRDRQVSLARRIPVMGRGASAVSAWLAVAAAAVPAGFGLLLGAVLGALPMLRTRWRRRTVVFAAVCLATVWELSTAHGSIGANLLVSLAVGVVVGPDFSRRDLAGLRRRTQS